MVWFLVVRVWFHSGVHGDKGVEMVGRGNGCAKVRGLGFYNNIITKKDDMIVQIIHIVNFCSISIEVHKIVKVIL